MKSRLLMLDSCFLKSKYINQTQLLSTKLKEKGYTIFISSYKKNKLLRLLDFMYSIVSLNKKYDLVYLALFSRFGLVWASFSVLLLKIINKPYIITLHGGKLTKYIKYLKPLFYWMLKDARYVVSPSFYNAINFSPIRSNITIIPNSIELNNFIPRIREKARPILIWVRAFHNIYNPSLVPKMINLLKYEFPNILVYMIGPDKHDGSKENFITEANKLKVIDNIILIGAIEHSYLPQWLDKADIFINTTNVDNQPVSVIEAMASGLCIVSTNVGGIPYLLKNEIDAILIPPNDPNALAWAVKRILTEDDLAIKLSQNALAKAHQFDIENLVTCWEKIINSITHND